MTRIVYVGPRSGTTLHRARALESLGAEIVWVEADVLHSWVARQLYRVGNRLRRPPDVFGANAGLLQAVRAHRAEVLWVDKGRSIRADTLRAARDAAPGIRLVNYSPDDMFNLANQSRQYCRAIPEYDLHVTTKSYNVAELRAAGARDVLFVDNAYEPEVHRPLALTDEERRLYGADVGFVGMYESERADVMLALAQAGIPVTVWSADWNPARHRHGNLQVHRRFLDGLDYARAVNATRINLGFLRKVNRDLQTTRSIEIPACAAFLLAERTDEHRRLFREGEEAEFFGSTDELIRKCRHYLGQEDARRRIAEAGRQRCLTSGYSNRERLAGVLAHVVR
ncbi:MAG TPA: glycosyltransferase [Candidatus Polarisedimenticolaceae bacterium]|nr:glycosyltransferase [Candidatus Polarisedimenticolaceae bacterium]